MSRIVPTTSSPGFLALRYGTETRWHRTSMRLVAGVDLNNLVNLESECINWATALAAVLPDPVQVTDYYILDPDRVELYHKAFDRAFLGTHPQVSGTGTSGVSKTICFTGRGVGPVVENVVGQWAGRIFIGAAYEWAERVKTLPVTTDSALQNLWQFYEDSIYGPGDFYGQHVELFNYVSVQRNAYAQNHWGN